MLSDFQSSSFKLNLIDKTKMFYGVAIKIFLFVHLSHYHSPTLFRSFFFLRLFFVQPLHIYSERHNTIFNTHNVINIYVKKTI